MRGKLQGSPIKKGGVTIGWRVRVSYETETGAKKTKGFDRRTQKAAQDAAIEWLAKHGRKVTSTTDGTVSEAIDAVDVDLWAQLRGDNTRDDYKRCAEVLRAEFGDRLVSEVTSAQLTRYYKRFCDGSKRMMNEHWKVGRAVFGYAVSDLGWISVNPMIGARKPTAHKAPRQWAPLTREQFDCILPNLEEPYQLFYRTLAETGARPSEVWGLDTGERIDFQRDVYWFVVKKGKTDASKRRVPIPDSLARDLLAKGPRPFEPIAVMAYPSTHLRYVWEQAMAAAEIPYTRPYEVRAMRINEWRRMAIPGVVRKTMVGHTSEKTTNDWYDHINAEEVLKALGIGAKDDEGEE
jgi:integrase